MTNHQSSAIIKVQKEKEIIIIKKITCNPIFDRETWKAILDNLGVEAHIINNTELEFDVEAFKKIKVYEMPHFMYLNRDWMLR